MPNKERWWRVAVMGEDHSTRIWIVRALNAWAAIRTLNDKAQDWENPPVQVMVSEAREEIVL